LYGAGFKAELLATSLEYFWDMFFKKHEFLLRLTNAVE
jgi:hypothetical protein